MLTYGDGIKVLLLQSMKAKILKTILCQFTILGSGVGEYKSFNFSSWENVLRQHLPLGLY
jgi:hypothetical protein